MARDHMEKDLQLLEFARRLNNPEARPIFKCEQEIINDLLPKFHGFYLVQLGAFDRYDLKSASTMTYRFYAGLTDNSLPQGKKVVVSSLVELPFLAESIDLFFLPHTLEFSANPKKLLSEIYNILIPGGRVVILGYNPYCVIGLTRLVKSANNSPWFGTLRGKRQVISWLAKAGFTIDCHQYLAAASCLSALPFCGKAYVLVAQKEAVPLSPIKKQVYSKKLAVPSGFPEPSTNKGLYES